MFHEPSKQFLYSAYKIDVEYSDNTKIIQLSATGFVLEIGTNMAWIITNRHVLDIDYKKPTAKYKNFKLSKLTLTGRRSDDEQYSLQLDTDTEIFYHEKSENDIALIRAKGNLIGSDSIHWHFGLDQLANKAVFETVDPFDLICYTGFPSTHDMFSNRPIIRSGRIASDPKFEYSWNTEFQGSCVAYEGFSSEGASGSPIFAPPRGMRTISNSRHGYLIGVNAGHILGNLGHSGISYFYKSTVIWDIINKYGLMKL